MMLSASYNYINGTASTSNQFTSPNTNYYTLAMTAPIGTHLETFTYAYFDADNDRMVGTLDGLQYDSCCWAFRFAISHQWDGLIAPKVSNSAYENTVYVEFILKGLASFGSKLDTLLNSDFSGYNYR